MIGLIAVLVAVGAGALGTSTKAPLARVADALQSATGGNTTAAAAAAADNGDAAARSGPGKGPPAHAGAAPARPGKPGNAAARGNGKRD